MQKAGNQFVQSLKDLCYMCWQCTNTLVIYIVDILVDVMFNKACVECVIIKIIISWDIPDLSSMPLEG